MILKSLSLPYSFLSLIFLQLTAFLYMLQEIVAASSILGECRIKGSFKDGYLPQNWVIVSPEPPQRLWETQGSRGNTKSLIRKNIKSKIFN